MIFVFFSNPFLFPFHSISIPFWRKINGTKMERYIPLFAVKVENGMEWNAVLPTYAYDPPKKNYYSPKESSLKNFPRGPIGRVLSLPCIIPQRRVPQNSPRGPIVWESFFLSFQKIDFLPPYDPSQNPLLIVWLVGRITFWHF